jgi:integrase
MSPKPRVPTLRHHRPSGRAVVTINGKDYYTGRFGSAESKAEYQRLLAEYLAGGLQAGSVTSDLTINELAARYLKFADGYYLKAGKPTAEPENIGLANRPLRQLYGHTPASEFGPLRLQAVRQAMIDANLCRNEINKRIGKIVRMFKWATSQELIPSSIFHGLQSISGLRRGRSGVRESPRVTPVPLAYVEVVQPFVARQVWAMVQLQLLTGARSGEVCQMRTCDIDTRGRVWCFTPESHKTEHCDRERKIYLGPKAIEIVRPWLRAELEAYLFSPAEAMAEKRAEQRERRETPVQPSQRDRRKPQAKKRPGQRYDSASYRRAIVYAVQRANEIRKERGEPEIPSWHPHRLRHNAATQLRREFNIDVARAVLGHAAPAITERYAERDEALAVEAMLRVG